MQSKTVKTHELKSWPVFFKRLVDGHQMHEIRRNDREFNVGDVLYLREWDPDKGYTGNERYYVITGITTSMPGLIPGFCTLCLDGPWGCVKEAIT